MPANKCDDATIEANRQRVMAAQTAAAVSDPSAKFSYFEAYVSVVKWGVDASHRPTITLKASRPDGQKFEKTIEWGNERIAYSECPSTLPIDANDAFKRPVLSSSGFLQLSEMFVREMDMAGTPIATTAVDPNDPKFPWKRPDPAEEYRSMRVRPLSIVVRGIALDSGNLVDVTVDLMNGQHAQHGQKLTVDREEMQIALSHKVFAHVGVPFPQDPAEASGASSSSGASASSDSSGSEERP